MQSDMRRAHKRRRRRLNLEPYDTHKHKPDSVLCTRHILYVPLKVGSRLAGRSASTTSTPTERDAACDKVRLASLMWQRETAVVAASSSRCFLRGINIGN
jgi:hypothetical protein